MSKLTNITKSILFTTMLAASACSGDGGKQASQEANSPSFPESASRGNTGDLTAVAPVPTYMPTPMEEIAPDPEVASVFVVPEPEKFSEWMKRARVRFQSEDLDGALADYRMAVKKRPGAQRAQIQLARTLLALNNGAEGREPAEAALEIDGTSSLAWNTMGRVELSEGEHEAAIASFQRAAEEDADNSYAWNNLGYVLIEEGYFEEAIDALEEATTGGTPKAYMWNNLGMAYEHLDQIELARAAYRQAGDGGSTKALANFERLDGVISLLASGGETETAPLEPASEELELPESEETPVVAEVEISESDTGPVEVAEVYEP